MQGQPHLESTVSLHNQRTFWENDHVISSTELHYVNVKRLEQVIRYCFNCFLQQYLREIENFVDYKISSEYHN